MKTTTRSTAKGQKRKRSAADASAPVDAESVVAVAAVTAEEPVQEAATVKAGGAASVTLAANCSIKEVAALRESLCAVLDSQEPVSIDASAVERIDTATLQLLYAFVRDRFAADREVVWQGVTGQLSEAARLLGVRDLLNLPAVSELAA
ncbi:ABC-type transporter Mla MlaB component [Povalibacter uvarum]|uniref:ABC-type transporter Mla MlaB component n=1 Tax=Povalibacter uvarum TaxID=732238 RepID=A0A841HPT5_9GAMM|nr:STAS domain-containing protein [Povalibacter uvarum]MBB6094250.1 ABC-type transporter Mla MlaB component [Povalibacter uvarum]